MPTESLNLHDLNASQKVALMEQLWESLSRDAPFDPPEWHKLILSERESEWEERQNVSQDWAEAKDEIRKTL